MVEDDAVVAVDADDRGGTRGDLGDRPHGRHVDAGAIEAPEEHGAERVVPTAATIVTGAPIRDAATAWLAPLPPGLVMKESPSMVSPAAGIRAQQMERSMFMLPNTRALGTATTFVLEEKPPKGDGRPQQLDSAQIRA